MALNLNELLAPGHPSISARELSGGIPQRGTVHHGALDTG